MILLNQAGKNTHEDICSSLELFAREVMPEFHAREAEHQEWKRAVLAGEIELEEIDTEPYNMARGRSRRRRRPTKRSGSRIRSRPGSRRPTSAAAGSCIAARDMT